MSNYLKMSAPAKKRRTGHAISTGLNELVQAIPDESVSTTTEKAGTKRKVLESSNEKSAETYLVTVTCVAVNSNGTILTDTTTMCLTSNKPLAEKSAEVMRKTFGLLIELGQVSIDVTAYKQMEGNQDATCISWSKRYNQNNVSSPRLPTTTTYWNGVSPLRGAPISSFPNLFGETLLTPTPKFQVASPRVVTEV